jgi:two-component system sensor histidine kinase KdpD
MTAIVRPDPDQLLAQLREAEAQPARGRLRIYFGANAGVGKTYAMLTAARRELTTRRLLVGVVETHGRAETAAQLQGLPLLPMRRVDYRGRLLDELDLDAALARRPEVLLVDELAHSNAPGSRHAKRWQDVQELLDAGIDVWTTLNVQHIESLNGVVGAITGVRVHETIPDSVLDGADEVVLVDATPDELMARLAAGRVYLGPQAEHAARHFFRKGNLIALREIALRRTAERVEDEVRSYRVERAIDPVWNTGGGLLACVGPGEQGGQTVRTAARLAGQLNVRWHAVYVETPRLQRLPAARRDAVLAVLQLAEELGAQTAVLTGDDVATTLIQRAGVLNCAMLVLGRARGPWGGTWGEMLGLMAGLALGGRHRLAARLGRLAPSLDIIEAARGDRSRALARTALGSRDAADDRDDTGDGDPAPSGGRRAWRRYAGAVGASVATTLLASPLLRFLDLANIVMLFLLAVVLVAWRLGRGPAALAAVLNVAAFDFFFVQPRFSLAVSDVQYLLTFAVMLGVGLLVGQLTAGLRFGARVAATREQRAQALFELARDLSAALAPEPVAELGEAAVRRTFGGQARVLVMEADDALRVGAEDAASGIDASVADWVLRNRQPAGLATATLSANAWHYVPLIAPMRVRGVLALRPAHRRWLLIPEQARQLETLARQIAIALERVHYVEVAQQALVQVETEHLRATLLAAISHDIRTPLTALIGQAEQLASAARPEDAAGRAAAQALEAQARELGSLVTNLLDMARLQSGSVQLRRDWQSVEEVVGTAIRAARHALAGAEVRTRLPADLPLVEFDAVLIERALVNLLANAARHGRPPIDIEARALPDQLELVVRDHGDGLPARWTGREQDLFALFTRGQNESARVGVGLGLSIAKAVVEAHQGEIRAASASGGGAEFTLRLPRRPPPAPPDA